ncbi:glycosyltransferase family 2 protein [Enterobacter ludwigii]|uniref:glycosyltransferase family 2 protein n=1 Tax=Enterobacter ludwigii TaxID=299767 RepID=UPI00397635FF
MENKKKLLIILLNWNGSQDTLACCESIKGVERFNEGLVDLVIIDNDSNIDSYDYLCGGLEKLFGQPQNIEVSKELFNGYKLTATRAYQNVYLFKSSLNHGFAKGCNLGAKYAELKGYEYILFLNNDTVVEPDFLEPLLESIDTFDAVIPQIRYHHDKNLMWNCGGKLSKYGSRKYYYAKENINNIVFPKDVFTVTFATGCCLLFKTNYFKEIGRFSERFFFGEEDIELALRLMKNKARIVCNTHSIIYHKVGASIQGSPEKLLRKAYIHYLNRFVNMKLHLGILWYLWLIPSLMKVILNLIKINQLNLRGSYSFLKALIYDSFSLTQVDKNKFESVLKDGFK